MDIILERVLSLLPKKENGDFEFGSKKKFAQMLGLPHNTISMWISGDNESYKKKLHQIANIYNVSVEWLKGETDIKEKPTAESSSELSELDKKLHNAITQIQDEEKKRWLLKMIQSLSEEE